ncbi:GNAT family N-acetyltransferase [Methylobacterium sp. J-068]|uniref:GNAT family N-acetyltransferase n=1 Tax=Methylobacterium sp. J-068 TaxID=2836649 RepID=UPI001FBA1DEE|nr:GNAT family N-acetyltransferase [Methylobacterium sp. J-068]MCJ2032838.1 GNAT family N-acetyltransferase [Methylobacterium sp. J-068]
MTQPADRRPEGPADAEFLFALFASVHGPPLVGLAPALRDLLLRQGFAGQRMTYRARYPGACFDVVERAGTAIGRIVTDRGSDALTLVDIALLPARRGRGVGTRLLGETMEAARAAGLPLRLSVSTDNARAQRLYARLGFTTLRADDLQIELVWVPPGAARP